MKPPLTKLRSRLQRLVLAALAVGLLSVAVVAGAALRPAADAQSALRSGDYRSAHAALLEAAQAGEAHAQNQLGNLYYVGLGVETDYQRALGWYWKAASQGHIEAQLNMGHLYAQGLGVPLDPLRAFGWYRVAERSGSEKAKGLMRLIAGSMAMTPNQIQKANSIYVTVEDLRPQ